MAAVSSKWCLMALNNILCFEAIKECNEEVKVKIHCDCPPRGDDHLLTHIEDGAINPWQFLNFNVQIISFVVIVVSL